MSRAPWRSTAGRAVAAVATVAGLSLAAAVPGAVAAPAPALRGITPPRNPPKSLPPDPDFYAYCVGGVLDNAVGCNSKALEAIDRARETEPVGPLRFNLARFLRLSVAQQLFAIADMERVSRGETPMAALTFKLDTAARAGAVAGRDPEPATETLDGGARIFTWGSNWAGGTESALGSDDGWMYDDGPGGFNGDCNAGRHEGCWGHRDNILGLYSDDIAGCPVAERRLVMGAGYASRKASLGTSFAETFVAACGPRPTDVVFTWAEAERKIALSTA
jgi:hypothetical protein